MQPLITMTRRLALAALCLTMVCSPALAEKITVSHWGVLFYGVPYAVAMDKGYYKELGLDIDGVLTSKGGGTTMRNVMASELPYGEVALSAAISAMEQGIDVKIIHGGVRTAGEILWVTTPNSPVKSIKDLDGKKVAFTSPKSTTEMLLIMVAQKNGVKFDMVSSGGIGGGLALLQQGSVLAAPIMDPVWTRMQDKLRPVFFIKDELPPLTQSVGVTTSEFAKSNPEKLRKLVAARKKGVEFIYAHPEEAAAIIAKHYEMDPALALKSVKNLSEIRWWSEAELDTQGMDNLVRGLEIIGEVKGKVDWSKVIDRSFIP